MKKVDLNPHIYWEIWTLSILGFYKDFLVAAKHLTFKALNETSCLFIKKRLPKSLFYINTFFILIH